MQSNEPTPPAAIYRPLRADEESAALTLWATTFDEDPQGLRQALLDDPRRHPEQTRVAVAPDGTLLSAMHYHLREIRDVDGAPQRVGGLTVVATRPDARRQGHAGRLLEQTITAMRADGCAWSLLFTDINPYYERYGWRTYATRYRQGLLAADQPALSGASTTRAYDPRQAPGGWAPLAVVYAEYNARRPLTTVRDLPYWARYAPEKFCAPNARVWVAVPAGEAGIVAGYVLAHFQEQTFTVLEIGVRAGAVEAIPALLAAVVEEARGRGIGMGRVYIPKEPAIDAALAGIYQEIHEDYHHVLMGLPLAPGWDDARIAAIFAAPGAISWPADDF
jgi:GNAT superfamily N-acetyltransferase